MSTHSIGFLICLLFLLCFGSTGCYIDDIRDLEEYSKQTKALLPPVMGRYARSLQGVGLANSRKALRRTLRLKVLPALDKYVTNLQHIRSRNKKVQDIHETLTRAYMKWQKALQGYERALQTDTRWVNISHELLNQAKQISQAEKLYQKQSKAYILQLRTKAMTP